MTCKVLLLLRAWIIVIIYGIREKSIYRISSAAILKIMKIKFSILKLLIIFILFCGISPSTVYSSADMSVSGSYMDLGGEGALYGGGIIFSRDIDSRYIPENFSIFLSTFYMGSTENGGEMKEVARAYVPAAAGIEYLYPLYDLPLRLKISGGGGAGYFRKEEPVRYGVFIDYSRTMSNSSTAPFLFMNAGVLYTVSQRISFFADAGYHYSFMKEKWMSDPLAGVQINAGVRISVAGINRELE